MVATLKTGCAFVRCLLAVLPQVRRLLTAGTSVDVTKEAVVLLAMCHKVRQPRGSWGNVPLAVCLAVSEWLRALCLSLKG